MLGKKSPIENIKVNCILIRKVTIKIFDRKTSIIFPIISLLTIFVTPKIPRRYDVCMAGIPSNIAWSALYVSPQLIGIDITTKRIHINKIVSVNIEC